MKKTWKSKKFGINLHLIKDRLHMEFAILLKQDDARESADIICLICDAYR